MGLQVFRTGFSIVPETAAPLFATARDGGRRRNAGAQSGASGAGRDG